MGQGSQYPPDWNSRRRQIYKRDNYTCQRCGAQGGPRGDHELHAHHKTPISDGGTHDPRNLQTLCKSCHEAVHGHAIAPRPSGSFTHRLRTALFQATVVVGVTGLIIFAVLSYVGLWSPTVEFVISFLPFDIPTIHLPDVPELTITFQGFA